MMFQAFDDGKDVGVVGDCCSFTPLAKSKSFHIFSAATHKVTTCDVLHTRVKIRKSGRVVVANIDLKGSLSRFQTGVPDSAFSHGTECRLDDIASAGTNYSRRVLRVVAIPASIGGNGRMV